MSESSFPTIMIILKPNLRVLCEVEMKQVGYYEIHESLLKKIHVTIWECPKCKKKVEIRN